MNAIILAAGVFQRFQNTMLCSAGIGAAPQQAEIAHFHISRNGRFWAYVLHMHCLLLVSRIPDTNGYPDFCVIPTFQKRPAAPTALGRKVGITFCPFSGKEPAVSQKSV